MDNIIGYLLGPAFVPPGYDIFARPDQLALHLVSDVIIAAAYFAVPIVLARWVRRGGDMPYRPAIVLFATFILLCGVSHVLGLVGLWLPIYGLHGLLNALTAVVSLMTAVIVWPNLAKALALPSASALAEANQQLKQTILERTMAEQALRKAHDELERRVADRTAELSRANELLQAEVAERQHAEAEQRHASALLDQHVTNSPLGVIEWEPATPDIRGPWRVRRWSGQAEAIFGRDEISVLGLAADELAIVHPDDRATVLDAARQLIDGLEPRNIFTTRIVRADGSIRHSRWHNSIILDDSLQRPTTLSLVADITGQVEAQERAQRLALEDPLTGVPNRRAMHQKLDETIGRAKRRAVRCGMLVIDVDHFKRINDTLGHEAGDRVLVELAARLGTVIRASDTLARLGGDEFALILDEVADPELAKLAAARLLDVMRTPIHIAGEKLAVTLSIGIAVYPDHAFSAQQLLQRADMALYRSKGAGRGCARMFRPDTVALTEPGRGVLAPA